MKDAFLRVQTPLSTYSLHVSWWRQRRRPACPSAAGGWTAGGWVEAGRVTAGGWVEAGRVTAGRQTHLSGRDVTCAVPPSGGGCGPNVACVRGSLESARIAKTDQRSCSCSVIAI